MSDLAIGAVGFGVLLVLIALRVPIGVAMLAVGTVGYVSIAGTTALMSYLKTEMYWRFTSNDLSVIPLFLMMGHFAARAGMTTALFRAAAAWIGHYRGGLAMAAVGGCAAFGTVSGSSLATAAMMGQVALPELRRYKYSGAFATGALAAGGTLGILIPPSIVLIIYAIIVEGNIVELFQAGFPARPGGDRRLHDRHRHRGADRSEGRPGRPARHPKRALDGAGARSGRCW